MKVDILGVKIDNVSLTDALVKVEKWIWNPTVYKKGKRYVSPKAKGKVLAKRGFYIVTPNPEFIVVAQKDELFRKILNDADLSIPDGMGLKLSGKVKNTFSGTDFMEKLVKLAAEKGFATGFLGGKDEVAKRCAECLKKKYPGLKVVFAESGGEIDRNGTMLSDYRLPATATEDGRLKSVDILFVAFGHIKQEKWIAKNLDKIPTHVAMGVGGAFDYLSGAIPRAPKWMRNLGFEWLFRLVIQPWRIKRQLALLQYVWLLIFQKKI